MNNLVYSQDRINHSNYYSYNVPSLDFIHQFEEVQKIVSDINPDSIEFFVKQLQSFGTRYALASNRDAIVEWIKDQFERMGYSDIEIQRFSCYIKWGAQNIDTTTWQKNVITTLPGRTHLDEICIIGGHYDSFTWENPMNFAPGADDNASGTAAVLEIARVMKIRDYKPKCTVKFITFAAEEFMFVGNSGAEYYAQEAENTDLNIKLMINNDMISHKYSPLERSRVAINYYSGYEYLLEIAKIFTNQFTIVTPVDGELDSGSDSYPFWKKGFPSIYFEEYEFSPFWHSEQDTLGEYSMVYCAEVTKAAAALLLYAANEPGSFEKIEYRISKNYPNPFNSTTRIDFSVSEPVSVDIKIYDILGREITTIKNSNIQTGIHTITINAQEYNLASGVYLYRLEMGDPSGSAASGQVKSEQTGQSYIVMGKMVLIR
jgi:hypothetical protein